MRFEIPQHDGSTSSFELNSGDTLYVLGANGSGKSTLLFRWTNDIQGANLVPGNREIVFPASEVSISPQQGSDIERQAGSASRRPSARYTRQLHNDHNWLNQILFAIRSVGEHHKDKYIEADQSGDNYSKIHWLETMPITRINGAFSAASLPLRVDWTKKSGLEVVKEGVEQPYGFSAMSDGERSALIIAAKAVLADEGSAILVDEPERHLHRSISKPLIEYLQSIRPDLVWIIATHDLSLPRNDIGAKTLVLYSYNGSSWKFDTLNDIDTLDSVVAEAIYGARESVLFVEGENGGKDQTLYGAFFPGVKVLAAGNCEDVRVAVRGLGKAVGIHHMDAKGIVDADNRVDLDVLAQEGIRSLGVYAIESVYYHPFIIEALLGAAGSGSDASLPDVITKACAAISNEDLERLSRDAEYKLFRSFYRYNTPSIEDFDKIGEELTLRMPDVNAAISARVQTCIGLRDSGDWLGLIGMLKVKGTKAPGVITKMMGYAGGGVYEKAARRLVRLDEALRERLRVVVPDPFT